MLKHIYRAIILAIIFAASVFFMGKNIKEVTIDYKSTIAMNDATFPVIYIKSGGYQLNQLHGYSSNINSNVVRESITPILTTDKSFEIYVEENESHVKKIQYEVSEVKDNKLLDTGVINALENTKNGKMTAIKINANLDTSKEYALKIIITTKTSKKIHYYTRLKYYEEDAFFKEKMDFVKKFHESIMDKKNAEEITKYLEPDMTADNSSLSKVTIHSNFDLVSWGGLKPTIISEVIPTIKEFNIETAAIQLSYYISAKTDSGTEFYQVKEFYRVRYTMGRIYLLNYERTMEAVFNPKFSSLSKGELKIGISQDKDLKIVTNTNNDKICFVRDGDLWSYNLKENKAVEVFSFLGNKTDYARAGYDQHNTRILNMDEEGNIDFLVYGYMNRGDYEGRVAMILYRYYAADNRIEEEVYIPLETTYQMLKEDLNSFCYVSKKGNFYFTINNQVYSYNIIAKRLTTVAKDITDDNFLILKNSNSIAWLDTQDITKAKSITILNLETEERKIIQTSEGNTIKILGTIDANIIYGFAKTKDIFETTDGSIVIPVNKLEIADVKGNILKEYKRKNIYVKSVSVKENVMKLERLKKDGNAYKKTSSDSILTKTVSTVKPIHITSRTSKATLKELYITMQNGFTISKLPDVSRTKTTIVTEDTTLHLNNEQLQTEKYYVYALGEIIASYNNPAKAVILADEEMGVVISSNNQIVWERGGKFNRKTIAGIQLTTTGGGVNSRGACVNMLLKYNLISKSAKDFSNKSMYNSLKENLKTPVNLTSCNLDEVLYFVSCGRPVIAMKDASHAVLITGYDEYYIIVNDPGAGSSIRIPISTADNLFKKAGNIFISYIN